MIYQSITHGQDLSGLNSEAVLNLQQHNICVQLLAILIWRGVFAGWFYFCGGLISGVVLFVGWSYFWGGLISGVVLFLGWSYFWHGLISGVVLFLGWSYFWHGLISGVV